METEPSLSGSTNNLDAAWPGFVQAAAERVIGGAVPGLIILTQKGSRPPEVITLGIDADSVPLRPNMFFPVASITKLATALAILRMVDAGRLELDEPIARRLKEAAAAKDRSITVRSLLCHASGLPIDLPAGAVTYDHDLTWEVLAQTIQATTPSVAPWTVVQYSNIGYGLLGILVERIANMPFRLALREWVLHPLGIEGSIGEEPQRIPARIAGNLGDFQGTHLEPYNSAFWRSLALPYGGLVTTAEGAWKLVKAFTGMPTGFLSTDLAREATSDQSRGLGGGLNELMQWDHNPWGLGVELRGEKSPHIVTSSASPASFGHRGFSGALAWYDPVIDLAWVILGPRPTPDWRSEMFEVTSAVVRAVYSE